MAEKVVVYDGSTGSVSERPLGDNELALRESIASVEAERLAKEQAEAEAKASAVEKLRALGLTVDEVAVAFGLEA